MMQGPGRHTSLVGFNGEHVDLGGVLGRGTEARSLSAMKRESASVSLAKICCLGRSPNTPQVYYNTHLADHDIRPFAPSAVPIAVRHALIARAAVQKHNIKPSQLAQASSDGKPSMESDGTPEPLAEALAPKGSHIYDPRSAVDPRCVSKAHI